MKPHAPAATYPIAAMTHAQVRAVIDGPHATVALVPIGATEAHGPHLPLATDSLISTAVAELAGAQLAAQAIDTLIFPTVQYTVTDWAAAFTGTVSIPTEAASTTILTICRVAHAMGVDRVALVNSHLEPDNVAMLREVAAQYLDEFGEPLIFADQTRRRLAERLGDEFRSGSCHAGRYETSLVLAITPELVDKDAMRSLPRLEVPLHERIQAGARNFLQCGMDEAYCGDPAGASAEEGEQLLATLADMTATAVLATLSRTSG